MRLLIAATLLLALAGKSCQPVEQSAYQTVVASNAFLKSIKAQHPECPASATALCVNLFRAVSAKDALIDAVEVYCAGPDFAGGGKCNPPAKGTPASTQALAKLQAALAQYSQAESDLKGVVH